MDRERLGLVGGLAADRPVLVAVLIALGLTALTALDVKGASDIGYPSGGIADLLIAFLILPVLPLGIASAAPRRPGRRFAFTAAVAVVLLGALAASPMLPLSLAAPVRDLLLGAFVLTLILTVLAPFSGGHLRLAFLGALAAVLAVAASASLMRFDGASLTAIGLPSAVGVAFGALVAVGVAAEFAAEFAKGARQRPAAGVAVQRMTALALFAIVVAVAAFPLRAAGAELGGGAWRLASAAGAAAALSVTGALLVTGGGLALHRATERVAVEDNARRQTQRRLWRPLRKVLPVRSAFAALAIVAILLVVAALDLAAPPGARDLAFVSVVAAAAGLVFFSLRSGVFVLSASAAALVLAAWLAQLIGVAAPPPPADSAALAIIAALFGQLALAWRDARSPRLNARETMEAAMSDGMGRFAVGLSVAAGALYAAGAAGAAPHASEAAGYMLGLGLIGAIIAPPLMTALSGLGGREVF